MAVNQIKPKYRYWNHESFMHSLAHFAGTISPIIIVVVICIFSPLGNLWDFLKEGDFCLFSAAILTPATYTFAKYKGRNDDAESNKQETFASYMWVISIILIGISTILFSLIYIHSIFPKFPIYPDAIVVVSIIFLVLSMVIFYSSRFINREIEYDINEIKQEDFEDFEAKYNQLNS